MTTPAHALTASDVAEQLGITAKELRVFLRADGTYKPVTASGGRGRYAFNKTDVAKIKKAYPKWVADRAASRKAKGDAKVAAEDANTAEAAADAEAS